MKIMIMIMNYDRRECKGTDEDVTGEEEERRWVCLDLVTSYQRDLFMLATSLTPDAISNLLTSCIADIMSLFTSCNVAITGWLT